MLQKINRLLKSTEDAEMAFEELRDSNEDKIKVCIKSSKAYQALQNECIGEYGCFISILSMVRVVITYRLHDTFKRQSISISQDGIDVRKVGGLTSSDDNASLKLHSLADKFYKEFYNK